MILTPDSRDLSGGATTMRGWELAQSTSSTSTTHAGIYRSALRINALLMAVLSLGSVGVLLCRRGRLSGQRNLGRYHGTHFKDHLSADTVIGWIEEM